MNLPWFSKRAFFGLLVLGIGVMLLLDTTGALGEDTSVFGTYWPVLLIAAGMWQLGSRGFQFRLVPLIVLILGIVFLLAELDVGSLSFGELWPVIVIVLGGTILLRGLTGGRRGWRRRFRGRGISSLISGREWTGTRRSKDGEVRAIFAGAEERVTSQEFQHLRATAIFGGIELDLRKASLAGDNATLEVTVLFGGIELKVPRGWTVNDETAPLGGQLSIERRQPEPGEATGALTITGTLIFGGITVRD
jgi:hypothetical protein